MKYLILLILCTQLLHAHKFEVKYTIPDEKPVYTPTVYIAISQGFRSPRSRMGDWANLPILFAVDDLDGDGKVTIDKQSLGTVDLSNMEGKYAVQAIVRINPDWMLPGDGEGDLYSKLQRVEFIKDQPLHLKFNADITVPAPKFRNEGAVQDHYLKSKRLTEFHKRDFNLRYSVILPEDWDAAKKYPVIVFVTGFTGVHQKSTRFIKHIFGEKGKKAIIVVADANCRWGHSVFANSIVNGPWGDALTYELLPHIDKTYAGAGAKHRYITGISSGGWAAAWAIVSYPEAYAGAWPIAPDPVDFEAFQELNFIDKKQDNLFTINDQGEKKERLLCIPSIGWTYKHMAKFEHVLGAGGQLKSFAAVFSSKLHPTNGGAPDHWYDIATGSIDMAVTDSWRPFDISQKLESNWKELKPKLKGKMHFGIHQTDTFLLDHSIRRLEEKCKELGSDATFTYFEGIGHHMPLDHAERMMDSVLKSWEQHADKAKPEEN